MCCSTGAPKSRVSASHETSGESVPSISKTTALDFFISASVSEMQWQGVPDKDKSPTKWSISNSVTDRGWPWMKQWEPLADFIELGRRLARLSQEDSICWSVIMKD